MNSADFNQFSAASEAFVTSGDRQASQYIEHLLSDRCQRIKTWYQHLCEYKENSQNSNGQRGHNDSISVEAVFAQVIDTTAFVANLVSYSASQALSDSGNGGNTVFSAPLLAAVLLLKKYSREYLPLFLRYEKQMRYLSAGRKKNQTTGGNGVNYETQSTNVNQPTRSYCSVPQVPYIDPSTVPEPFSWILQAVAVPGSSYVAIPIPFTAKLLALLLQLRTLSVEVLVALIAQCQSRTLHISGASAEAHQTAVPIAVWTKNPIIKMLFHVIGVMEVFIWSEEPLAGGGADGKKFSHTAFGQEDESSAMATKLAEVCHQVLKMEICGSYSSSNNSDVSNLSSPNILENVMAHYTSISRNFYDALSSSNVPAATVGHSQSTLSALASQLAGQLSQQEQQSGQQLNTANAIANYYQRIASQIFIADRIGPLSSSGIQSDLQALSANQNTHPQYQQHQHPILHMTTNDIAILGSVNVYAFVLVMLRNVVESLADRRIAMDFMLRAKVQSSMQLGAVPMDGSGGYLRQPTCMCGAILRFIESGLSQLLLSYSGLFGIIDVGNQQVQQQANFCTISSAVADTTTLLWAMSAGQGATLAPTSPFWPTSLASILYFVQLSCETLSLTIGAAMETASIAGQTMGSDTTNEHNFRKNDSKKTSKPVSPWGESFWLMLAPTDPSTTFPANEPALLSANDGADRPVSSSVLWDFILKSGFVMSAIEGASYYRAPLVYVLASSIKLQTSTTPQLRVLAECLSTYVATLGSASPISPLSTSQNQSTSAAGASITVSNLEECPLLEVAMSDVLVKVIEVISMEGTCSVRCMAAGNNVNHGGNNGSNNEYEEGGEDKYMDLCAVASAAIVRGLRFVQPPSAHPLNTNHVGCNVSCKPLFRALFMGVSEAAVPLLNSTTEKYVSEAVGLSCQCCADQYVNNQGNNQLNPFDLIANIVENGNLSLKSALFLAFQTTLSHVITDPITFSVLPPLAALAQRQQSQDQSVVMSSATAAFPLISLLSQRSQAVTINGAAVSSAAAANKGSISIGRVLDIRLCAALELISPSLGGLTMVLQALAPQSIPPFDEENDDVEDFGFSVVDEIDAENVRKRLTIFGLFSSATSAVTEEKLQAPYLLSPDSFFIASASKIVAHLITSFANARCIEREVGGCGRLLCALSGSEDEGSGRSLLVAEVLSFLSGADDATLLYGTDFHETALHYLNVSSQTANGAGESDVQQKDLPTTASKSCATGVTAAEQFLNAAGVLNTSTSPSPSAFHKGLADIHKHSIAAFISCLMHLSAVASTSITTRRSVLMHIVMSALGGRTRSADPILAPLTIDQIPVGRSNNNNNQAHQCGVYYMTAHDDEDRNGTHNQELQAALNQGNNVGAVIVPFLVDPSSQPPEQIVQNLIALNPTSATPYHKVFTPLGAIHSTIFENLSSDVGDLDIMATGGGSIDIASLAADNGTQRQLSLFLCARSRAAESDALTLLLEAACIPTAFSVLRGTSKGDGPSVTAANNLEWLQSSKQLTSSIKATQSELSKQSAEHFAGLWALPLPSTGASAEEGDGLSASTPFPTLLSLPSTTEMSLWLNRLQVLLASLRDDAAKTIPSVLGNASSTAADSNSLALVQKSLLADFHLLAQSVEVFWYRSFQQVTMMATRAERVLAGKKVMDDLYGQNYNGNGWPLWLEEEYSRAGAVLESVSDFWSWIGTELLEAVSSIASQQINPVALLSYRDLLCRMMASTIRCSTVASEDQLRFHVPMKVKAVLREQRPQRVTNFVTHFTQLCTNSNSNNSNVGSSVSVTGGIGGSGINNVADIIQYAAAKPLLEIVFRGNVGALSCWITGMAKAPMRSTSDALATILNCITVGCQALLQRNTNYAQAILQQIVSAMQGFLSPLQAEGSLLSAPLSVIARTIANCERQLQESGHQLQPTALSGLREAYLMGISGTFFSPENLQKIAEVAFAERQRQEESSSSGNGIFDAPLIGKVTVFTTATYIAQLLDGPSSPIAFSTTHINLLMSSLDGGSELGGAALTSGWLSHISSNFQSLSANVISSSAPQHLQLCYTNDQALMWPCQLLLHTNVLELALGTAACEEISKGIHSSASIQGSTHRTLMKYFIQVWLPTLETFATQVASLGLGQPPQLQNFDQQTKTCIAGRIEAMSSVTAGIHCLFGPQMIQLLGALACLDVTISAGKGAAKHRGHSSDTSSPAELLSRYPFFAYFGDVVTQKLKPAVSWVLGSCLNMVEKNVTYLASRGVGSVQLNNIGQSDDQRHFRSAMAKVALGTVEAMANVAEFYHLICSNGDATSSNGAQSIDLYPISDILCSLATLNLMKLTGIGSGAPAVYTPSTGGGSWQQGTYWDYFGGGAQTSEVSGLGDTSEDEPLTTINVGLQLRRNESWHKLIKSCIVASFGSHLGQGKGTGGLGSAFVTLLSNPSSFANGGQDLASIHSFYQILSAVLGNGNTQQPFPTTSNDGAVFFGNAQEHILFVLNHMRTSNDVDEVAALYEQLCAVVSLLFAS